MSRAGLGLKPATVAKLEIAPEAKYRPCTSVRERRAYHAAFRIMDLTEHGDHERSLAAPGGRRSRRIDRIAEIIMESGN